MIIEDKDLISIIVPVFNRETVLDNCIQSILNQTYRNIQLILVDDGSTDNSFFLCQSYAIKDPRVQVLHQTNNGPASARNTGLDASLGKYIMFVDSDDCIHYKCIEIMYNATQQFGVSLVTCEYAGIHLQSKQYNNLRTVLLNTNAALKNGFNDQGTMLYGCGKLWRRSLIQDIRFESLSFCEDTLFNIKALLNYQGYIVNITNGPLYYYMQKNDSITKNLTNKNLLDSLYVVGVILKRTGMLTKDIKDPLRNYSVRTAFYAYLQSNNEKDGVVVKKRALSIIQKYRKNVLLNYSSSFKEKAACLISFFSMSTVQLIYGLIKG